jgi:diguanylate cyclase (GGDEF)-like protein/PAS domain S-box-containing protein
MDLCRTRTGEHGSHFLSRGNNGLLSVIFTFRVCERFTLLAPPLSPTRISPNSSEHAGNPLRTGQDLRDEFCEGYDLSDVPLGDGLSRLQRLLYAGNFFNKIRTGIVLQNAEGEVLDYNEAAASLLGVPGAHSHSELSFAPLRGAVREDGSPFPVDKLPGATTLRTGETCLDVIVGIDIPGRVRRWLSVDTYLLEHDGEVMGVVLAFDDIDNQWHERHLLKLLAEVNRVVMSAVDEAESLQHLCTTLVETGRYSLAWIGVASDDDRHTIGVKYSAGKTDYLLEGEITWSPEDETGLGPSGTAMRTGTSQIANDLANDPGFEPWRDKAAKFGFGSSLAIPFTIGEKRAGLFVYSSEKFAFDDATVRGLEQIAKEVGFGVAYVRSVQQNEAALERTITAIDAQRATEHALNEAEQRFRIAFENNMAPMTFADPNDLMIAANGAFCLMVGYSLEELIGKDSKLFTYPDDVGITEASLRRVSLKESDQMRYVKRYLRKDGRVIVSEVSRSAARNAEGEVLYFVFSERDITEERVLAAQLSHQAFHDPLTGLANRALFEDRLVQAHARVVRQEGLGAVLLLDLDDFKGVNDTYGHLIGDQLLVGIARRFELVTRSTDTLSRFGGDEFLYLAEGLTSEEEAEEVAHRLLDVLAEPFSFGGLRLEQHASVGIVVWDSKSTDSTEFVQNADVALYVAKRQQRGKSVLFSPSMHQEAVSRFTLIQELRRALETDELMMHYQPIVDLTTGVVVGFEALMRWNHPTRGRLLPGEFIALAEQSDLILELGSFALRQAVSAATTWRHSAGLVDPFVTVNLSAHQFYDPNLIPMIEGALAASNLAPGRLILEITESVALLDIAETLSAMQQLSRLGIGLALDDFGTGYSSLSYLAMLHPRVIKIDQSFVRPAHESEQNDSLLETIISLGDKLGMIMLAEGIESPAQLERLRRSGCDLGQGFLFSAAVPASDAAATLGRRFSD